MRRPRRLFAAVAIVASVSACAGMPTGGSVHLGRVLPVAGGLDDLNVRVLPPSWNDGMSQSAVVTAFLRALVNDDDDYAIARSYLSVGASARWRPSAGVTTYDDVAVQPVFTGTASATRAALVVRAPRIGHIDRRGDYEQAPGRLVASFTVVRSGRGWRIDRLPDGVMLSVSDAQRSFRAAEVYYLNRPGTTLVPEQILLQNSQRGVATALVAALLNGPGGWLAPAVHTAAPPRTALIGNVPVHDNGVADVNVSSSIRQASAADLAAFSAQLVWTLRQVADVSAVRLLADGAPVTVPGVPSRQPISSWRRFDPAAAPSSRDVVYVEHGHLRATGGDLAALARSDPGGVVSVARSRDGETLAVVQHARSGLRLLVGRLGRPLTVRVSATSMTGPTFDADGDVLTVVTNTSGRHVLAVTREGGVVPLAVDRVLVREPVTAMRVSRDGARVAAIVGAGQVLVGRVVGGPGGPSLTGFRAVAPTLRGARGLTWWEPDELVFTAAAARGQRQIVVTDSDGYAPRSISLDRMRGRPVDVTGAPGQTLVAVTDRGGIWVEVEGWRRLADGTAAVHSG